MVARQLRVWLGIEALAVSGHTIRADCGLVEAARAQALRKELNYVETDCRSDAAACGHARHSVLLQYLAYRRRLLPRELQRLRNATHPPTNRHDV
jgi:hypothetical protein